MHARTTFQTDQARRHLASLCQHFARKVPVLHDARSGHVEFPFGFCDLKADSTGLELIASAKDQAGLDTVIEVITSHLDRFAFRENPQLDWQQDAGSPP